MPSVTPKKAATKVLHKSQLGLTQLDLSFATIIELSLWIASS
jgi:hypothetical protein